MKVKNLSLSSPMIILPWNVKKGEYQHKTAKKTRRDRTICLPLELATELREKAAGRGMEEPLFLTKRGRAWKRSNLTDQWKKVREQPEFVAYCKANKIDHEHVIPYSFRHTWASDWIDSGRSIKICAALMGTSVTMIERVYGHHDEDTLYMAYATFMAGR